MSGINLVGWGRSWHRNDKRVRTQRKLQRRTAAQRRPVFCERGICVERTQSFVDACSAECGGSEERVTDDNRRRRVRRAHCDYDRFIRDTRPTVSASRAMWCNLLLTHTHKNLHTYFRRRSVFAHVWAAVCCCVSAWRSSINDKELLYAVRGMGGEF